MPIRTTLLGATLALALPAMAGEHALLQPAASDLVPTTLHTPAAALSPRIPGRPTTPAMDHRPAHVSWKLDARHALAAAPKPFVRESREYWKDVSESELRRGIELPLSAPGALLRVSPVGGDFGRLDPAQLQVGIGRQTLRGDRAARHSADASALRRAGMAAADGSLVMELRPELGAGRMRLQAAEARGRYVVHVFEPASAQVLRARTDRDSVAAGRSVRLDVSLRDGDRQRPLDAVGGYLVAPDGHVRTLDYRRDADGHYHVEVRPDPAHGAARGLWELHTFASGTAADGSEVLRDATTAFAVSPGDARLDGRVDVRRRGRKGRLDLLVGIQATAASRYAVSGVLYGHAADGALRPIAYAQSADWLPAGTARIDLRFDAGALAGSGLRPPYELHDLRLMDQARLGLLERRGTALRFTP